MKKKKKTKAKSIDELLKPGFKNRLLVGRLNMKLWRAFKRKLSQFNFQDPAVCHFIEVVEGRFLEQLSQSAINSDLELRNARTRSLEK